jgi:hypothetical protein
LNAAVTEAAAGAALRVVEPHPARAAIIAIATGIERTVTSRQLATPTICLNSRYPPCQNRRGGTASEGSLAVLGIAPGLL